MGLFQKKPQVSNSAPLYTLGLNKTVLVVGLGNIGKKYDNTRHNIGFVCVDDFSKNNDFGAWVDKKDLKCHLTSGTIGAVRVIIIKPTTLMNLSGEAVQAAAHFYKVDPKNILVVHDELDVPFGQIRMRTGGSAAGHNGLKSVIQHIGEDFNRVRVGIGNSGAPQRDSADFVLAAFDESEKKHMSMLTREVGSIITEFVSGGDLSHETRAFIV